MHHKIIGFLLAAVLLVAPAAPAFASETVIQVGSLLPEITVTVPATGEVVLNPYSLPVEVDGGSMSSQVISGSTVLRNDSRVPLRVDVHVGAVVPSASGMVLAQTSTKGRNPTEKEIFLYLELQATNAENSVDWDEDFDPEKHLVVSESADRENMLTLAANGETGCYGAFRVSGDCAEDPETPWNDQDSVNILVSFTFHPLTAAAEAEP